MINQDYSQSPYLSQDITTDKAASATQKKIGSTVYIIHSLYAKEGKQLKDILTNLLLQDNNCKYDIDSKVLSGYNKNTETHSLAVLKGVKFEQ